MRRTRLIALTIAIATTSALLSAQGQPRPATTGYQLPPQVIVDMLDAAPPPTPELSPTRDGRRPAAPCQHADDRRAVAADVANRGSSHQPADQRAAPRELYARDHDQVDRGWLGEEGHCAGQPNALLDRVLAGRQTLRLLADARQRHRVVDRRIRDRTGEVDHARRTQRIAGHAL